jgi:hypothetical protein
VGETPRRAPFDGASHPRRTRSFQRFARSPEETVRQRHKSEINPGCSLRPPRLSLACHGHGQTAHKDCRIDAARLPATLGSQDFVHLPNRNIQPLLWRSKFEERVTIQLVTFTNPVGTITNSDLELAASIAQHDVLAQQVDVPEATIHNLTDNTATLYWQGKGATSTTGPASRLLRIQSLHQRHHRYVPSFDYIPGEANAMSDDCSRRWDLTDKQLLVHFHLVFPQSQPWRI